MWDSSRETYWNTENGKNTEMVFEMELIFFYSDIFLSFCSQKMREILFSVWYDFRIEQFHWFFGQNTWKHLPAVSLLLIQRLSVLQLSTIPASIKDVSGFSVMIKDGFD